MALRIPKNATKLTQSVIAQHGKLYANIAHLACPDDDTELRGAYFLPMIGKDKGNFYLIMVGGAEDHPVISMKTLSQNRMCSLAELLYARTLFFENEDRVVQFIPSDPKRVASLGRSTVLFLLKPGMPMPSDDEIGNIPNPRIILLNQ